MKYCMGGTKAEEYPEKKKKPPKSAVLLSATARIVEHRKKNTRTAV